MKYGWDTKRIISLLKSKTSRSDIVEMIKSSIKTPEDDLEILRYDGMLLASMPKLQEYLETFNDKGYEYKPTVVNKKNSYTKEDALTIAKEYYKYFDQGIYPIFEEIYAKRNQNLRFSKNDRKFDSRTYVCPTTNEVLMSVNFKGDFRGVVNLVHEFSHAIGYTLCPYENRTGINDYFVEIESTFHTLLFLDFFEKMMGQDEEITSERNKLINAAIKDSSSLENKYRVLAYFKEYIKTNQNQSLEGFKHYIKECTKISDEDFDKATQISISDDIPYLIGSYIGFELYHLFQTNPTYAAFIYRNINTIYATSISEYFNQIDILDLSPGANIRA